MYGMEDKKKTDDTIQYELEREIRNKDTLIALEEKIVSRINTIKDALNKDTDTETCDRVGTVLHGYLALQAVVQGTLVQQDTQTTQV